MCIRVTLRDSITFVQHNYFQLEKKTGFTHKFSGNIRSNDDTQTISYLDTCELTTYNTVLILECDQKDKR